MSGFVRTLLAVLVSVASVAVGVVTARSLQDRDQVEQVAAGTAGGDPAVIVAGDLDATEAVTEQLTVIDPVAVGDDPSIIDTLLAGAPDPAADDEPAPEIVGSGGGSGEAAPGTSGTSGATGTSGTTDTSDTVTTGTTDTSDTVTLDGDPVPWGGEPVVLFDPVTLDLFDLPLRVFDLCAGARAGSPIPGGCPSGFAATLFDAPMPPDPFLFGAVGHPVGRVAGAYSACSTTPVPDSGETAVTVWSVTPLASFTVEWRRYGSTRAWQQLAVEPATDSAVVDAWTDRLAAEPYDRATWGMIPHCVVVTRDPNRNFSGRVTATDIYGRVIEGNGEFLLPDATPDRRPPTTANIVGVQPMATVTAWTVPEGSVRFNVKAVTDPSDTSCNGAVVPDAQVHQGSGLAAPVGAWRPEYNRWWTTNVLLPPGGMVVVCATVFDSDNTLRPVGTDTLLLHAPTAQRPRIVLEGVRLNSGVTIDTSRLGIQLALPDDPSPWDDACARSWGNDHPLASGGTVASTVLWECDTAPLPVDSEGRMNVPVQVVRGIPVGTGSDLRREVIGIPIDVDTCTDVCPPRASEWFEVPIPGAGTAADGAVIVRLDYALTEGPARSSDESVAMVDSTDRPLADPTSGEPIVTTGATTSRVTGSNVAASVRVLSDREITITSARFLDGIGGASSDCREHRATVSPRGAATEFDVAATLCLGMVYMLELQYTDAAGEAYTRQLFGAYTPAVVSNAVDTDVAFHGVESGARLGWIYRFQVSLDGQDSSAYGMYLWSTPARGASGTPCMAMDGTTADSRTDPRIVVSAGALEVHVLVHITTTGSTDCSGNPSTGLPVIELDGTFTMAELLSGDPLVLSTDADSPLQMTVTVNGHWFVART